MSEEGNKTWIKLSRLKMAFSLEQEKKKTKRNGVRLARNHSKFKSLLLLADQKYHSAGLQEERNPTG